MAVGHDLVLITDEIYEQIRYVDRPHPSLPSLPDCQERTVTINGFSKGYPMTGWRLGYAAGPAAIIDEMIKVQEHTSGAPPRSLSWLASQHSPGRTTACNKWPRPMTDGARPC